MSSLKTKPAPVRTRLRFEPPTLEEAIFAAQGVTNSLDGQTEIAASLMGLSEAEVRGVILKAAARPRISSRPLTQARFAPSRPPVVVERRGPRALIR